MSKLWVDPPEGWKYGFPAIYDSETDGQMSEWIVRKGYPLLTIKEYGEQWHIRCWPAEEPEKYPDKDISAQKQSKDVKNAPIGTEMRKTTREEKISRPAVYEVPKKTTRKVTVSQDDTPRIHTVEQLMDELAVARMLIHELGDRLAKLEKTEQEPVAYINIEERKLEWAYKYMSWDTPTVVNLPKIPLYTNPPQRTWVGLTDEELCEIVGVSTNDSDWNVFKVQEWLRKVEAKLKEKNNG